MLWLALLLLLLPFGAVLFYGAPYVPTKQKLLIAFLRELGVRKEQSLLDLGSGDGTVLVHAAKELEVRATGIELNPFLVAVSRLRSIRNKHVRTIYGNVWTTKLPEADVIYVFILPKFMDRMEEKIKSEIHKKTLVVTYAFTFKNHKPVQEKDGFYAFMFQPLAKK